MKKIIGIILILSIVLFAIIMNNNINQKSGEGTFDNPLKISDINTINHLESIFKEKYNTIFKDSNIKYTDNTDTYWKPTHSQKVNNKIQITHVHYIGNQMQANMMIIFTCQGIDEHLKQEVISRFKDEDFIITTSYHSLDIDLSKKVNTSLFSSENSDPFSLKLADDILNDYAKMIIEYKMFHEGKWYQLSSLINITNPQYLSIPNTDYGIGELERR